MFAVFTLIIFLCAMVIQTSVLPYLTIGDIKPDLVVVIVIYLGLMKGPQIGCLSGFFFGLLEDTYSGMFLGANAFTKTITGFLFGQVGKRLYTQSLFTHILCVGIGTGVEVIIALSIQGFGAHWKQLLLYEMLYNMICSPWIVMIFRFGEQRLSKKTSP